MTKISKRERAINKFGNPVAKNAWKNNKAKTFVNKVKYNRVKDNKKITEEDKYYYTKENY